MQDILEEIYREVEPLLDQGKVADYIPELAKVDPQRFGMVVRQVDGEVFEVGDSREPFSIQSISKVFTLSLAMHLEREQLWDRVGKEPSGAAFDSLMLLESELGKPRNPFINAGALVITDVLLGHFDDASDALLDFIQRLAPEGRAAYDLDVARSEAETGHRNRALAEFLKSFKNLNHPVDKVLSTYFGHCAVAMTCADLAEAFLYLAQGGEHPGFDEPILSTSQTKYVGSLMLTCGTYDEAGDFAYRVGLPGKSGVGGGIAAVLPGEFSVAVWSPGLNAKGNSLAGTRALELLTTKLGRSIF